MGVNVVAIGQGVYGSTVDFQSGTAAGVLNGEELFVTIFRPSSNYSSIPHGTSYVVLEFRDSDSGDPVVVSGSVTMGVWASAVFTPMLIKRVGYAPVTGTTMSEEDKASFIEVPTLGETWDEEYIYPVIEFEEQSRIALYLEGKPTNVPWLPDYDGLALQLSLTIQSLEFDVELAGPPPLEAHGEIVDDDFPAVLKPGEAFTGLLLVRNDGDLVWETGSLVNLHCFGDCNMFACDGRLYFAEPISKTESYVVVISGVAPSIEGEYTLFFDLCVDELAFNDRSYTVPVQVKASEWRSSALQMRRSVRKMPVNWVRQAGS